MMRRAALLLSAVAATAKKRATKTTDASAGLRWRPADEFARLHPDAADAAPKTRLAREVKRSIAACVRPSKHYNETADLVKSMLLTDDKHRLPLLTFNGRIFAPPQYVVPFKNRGLVVMLASARRVRKKPLPNAVFSANMASRGGEVLTGQGEYPETVIARSRAGLRRATDLAARIVGRVDDPSGGSRCRHRGWVAAPPRGATWIFRGHSPVSNERGRELPHRQRRPATASSAAS